MEVAFLLFGFAIGAVTSCIVFILKPFKKDKIKYYVRKETWNLSLIKANLTKKEADILCNDLSFYLYGLDPKDYESMEDWTVKEVTIDTID